MIYLFKWSNTFEKNEDNNNLDNKAYFLDTGA